jgi:hypothetical protein
MNAFIPHDIFLAHVLLMIPHSDQEKAVMKAVKSQNVDVENLHFLLSYKPCLVPSYLICNVTYAQAAGFPIMLPKLQRLGCKLSKICLRQL